MNNKKILIGAITFIVLITIVLIIAKSLKKTDEIILKNRGGVSYNWEYIIEDKNIISFKEKESQEKTKNLVGGEVEEHFIFKGLKEGSTTIKFEYRNFVDNSVKETKKYKVKVDKKLRVDIKIIK